VLQKKRNKLIFNHPSTKYQIVIDLNFLEKPQWPVLC